VTSVHLEGLGVLGCYIARQLELEDIPFTWHDTEEQVNAWQACTGCIYPSGHEEDQQAYDVWMNNYMDDSFLGPYMEPGAYTFCTKRPPHQGKYPYEMRPAPLKVAWPASLHVDVPNWIKDTRERYEDLRTTSLTKGSQLIVAHGFGPRLQRWMWGWTVRVKLRLSDALRQSASPRRPCIYLREGRFKMAYAYPIPHTDEWWAGSSLISQKVPKRLHIAPKYDKWRTHVMVMSMGHVKVAPVNYRVIHGWRPVPAEGDTAWVSDIDGALHVRPLWHSGLRHAPHVANAVLERL
jgi:hypothetical protein